MRTLLTTLSVLLLCAAPLAAEEKEQLSQEQLEAIAIQPASNWGKGAERVLPEMLALFKEESIQFGGTTRKYRLHVPENIEPGKKYPMILWLHGAGEAGSDNKAQLIHLHHIITYLTGEKKRDFFLLVPQYSSSEYWASGGPSSYTSSMNIPANMSEANAESMIRSLTQQTRAAQPGAVVSVSREGNIIRYTVEDTGRGGGPLEMAYAIIEQLVEKYPVDKNRITVSGLSTGGDGTWHALERRPDLFAAGAPLANWIAFSDKGMEKSPILKKIPVWSIYSSDDNGIDRARAEFDRVEKAGANFRKTEFGICGHTAWTPAMLQADIFAWLLSRAKDGDRFYAVYDPGVDPDAMKGIVDVATRDPGKPTLAPAVESQPANVQEGLVQVTEVALKTTQDAELAVARAKQETVELAAAKLRATELELAKAGAARLEAEKEFAAARAKTINAQGGFDPAPAQPIRISGMQSGAVQRMVLPDGTVQNVVIRSVQPAGASSPEKDKAYAALATRYLLMSQGQSESALRALRNCMAKMTPKAQLELIPRLVEHANSLDALQVLEELLDGASPQTVSVFHQEPILGIPMPPGGAMPVMREIPPAPVGPASRVIPPAVVPPRTTTISAEKIIEECNRPWAMTSDSLYGMFAADWDKEATAIPEFVVNSDSDALAKTLAKSISDDPESKDFVAACKSILLLTNKPMSSPWFETSGGRLRSEIQYSLSSKGQMFVRFLRVVAESGGNSDKSRELSLVAKKTLEKIDLVLEK